MKNVRTYGKSPYTVMLVHGGPGAPGEMRPVALELSSKYGVLEPLQTANTIHGQIEELKSVIETIGNPPVTLVGWSWGAWLSLLTTAQHPSLVKKLILVSSGPFRAEYAKKIMPRRLSRLSREDRLRAEELLNMIQTEDGVSDNDLQKFGSFMSKADSYNYLPETDKDEGLPVQMDIYQSIWKEAEELRKSGELLEYGKKITCPVTVIHGIYDSHPYEGIKGPLSEVIKNCTFHLLDKCGHHPWLEKEARDKFFHVLEEEIEQ